MVDWSRGDLGHRLTVYQVDPLNLTDVRGELSEVTGGSLDLDYYGDTRQGAQVNAHDHNWDGSAALRIVHTVYDYTGDLFTETLFTGYVTQTDTDGTETTFTLNSTLHGLETNVTPGRASISKSSKALAVMRSMFTTVSRPFYYAANVRDYLFGSAVVYDAGTSYLSMLYDVCNTSQNRLTVDGNGFAVVEPYTPPSQKTANWSEDTEDPRSMVVGRVTYSDNSLETPERVIVSASDGENTITVTAVAPAGTYTRHSVRGYCVDAFYQVSDLSPFTRAAAQSLANRYLNQGLVIDRKASHQMMYRPLREGDIELLTDAGETLRWQVASATLDFNSWIWSLELRGGWQNAI